MSANRRDTDRILIACLASGKSTQVAAAEAGISERTVYRRLEEPEFRQNMVDLRGRMVDCLTSRLTEASNNAFERLQILLTADSEYVQLGAARAILDQMLRLRNMVEFETRLTRVEELCDTPQDF
ncbi:MAG TPA: hypothetical protein VGM98_08570 [Schlesneria sp.]|jgi:hypothetical protein